MPLLWNMAPTLSLQPKSADIPSCQSYWYAPRLASAPPTGQFGPGFCECIAATISSWPPRDADARDQEGSMAGAGCGCLLRSCVNLRCLGVQVLRAAEGDARAAIR